MKSKKNKQSRNLLIAMLLGDGTISNNSVFKMAHGEDQLEYLQWKIKQLNNVGIRNCGIKQYIVTSGYNTGKQCVYTQLNILPFIKVLRRIMYRPKKVINNIKILNRLDAKGIAIWYMDDGHINLQFTGSKLKCFYVRLSTCQSKENNQIIIDYFKNTWNISFYQFPEGKNTYSLCCGTKEAKKFIKIVKPYILEIPSMWYKIRNKMTAYDYKKYVVENNFLEMPNTDIIVREDMV